MRKFKSYKNYKKVNSKKLFLNVLTLFLNIGIMES